MHGPVTALISLRLAGAARGLFAAAAWLLALVFLYSLALGHPAHANPVVTVTAARVWPAADYTRVTFESGAAIPHKVFSLEGPDRLVLDLDNVEISSALTALAGLIGDKDPYVKSVRVGRFKPGTIRLVFDLKASVRPQVFALAPVGQYSHRLVLDLYPLVAADPLIAFLDRHQLQKDGVTASERPVDSAETAAPRADTESAEGGPAAASVPGPVRRGRGGAPVRPIVVVLDAGHGGEDPGARGPSGINEKDITLSIARKLKARIDREPNMRAVMTRDGDFFIPLHMRVEKARRANADLFISIHADAFIRPQARGSSVFALSERGATSVAARWLAKRENDADLIGGVNLDVKDRYLKQTLLDLSQTATINDSLKLGKAVLAEIGGINTLHKSAVEQAGFAVLKAPDIPSILVETAFITNPEEEGKLRSEPYQARMADAIVQGIKQYFASSPALSRERMALSR